MTQTRLLPLALAAILLPSAALAHTGAGPAAGLAYGFGHPLGGLDHVLAMLGVGVLAGLLGGRAVWAVPTAFVGMMVVGFALGVARIGLPFVELAIALSSVAIGLAALTARSWPIASSTGAAMALVGAFAIFHGHAHGAEMPETAAGLAYAGGFVAATALLHAAGVALVAGALAWLGRHGPAAARLAGGAVALGGVGVLMGWA